MRRGKLPAYGKALWDNRRRGFHPLFVDVVYGDDWSAAVERAKLERDVYLRMGATLPPYGPEWSRAVGNPMLAIKPGEYAPGRYDFRCVAGCVVNLLDGCGAAADMELNARGEGVRFGIFYDLVRELAEWAADVTLPDLGSSAKFLAHDWRIYSAEARRFEWPRWWSDDLTVKNDQRFKGWGRAVDRRRAPATAGA